MNRAASIDRLRNETAPWDILIVGGGASGLGCAVDAASRGYRTALIEARDFASGTSSRSTKLVHGGVRYLKQGNLSLVRGALRERGLLRQNAPSLFAEQAFIIPSYRAWDSLMYGVGLKCYDALAGSLGLSPSELLSSDETADALPTLRTKNLRGGIRYYDGQFDDAALALALARTATRSGAAVANYVSALRLVSKNSRHTGVVVRDEETQAEFEIPAKAIINATGVLGDNLRRISDPNTPSIIQASQGAHIVLPRTFLPLGDALMVPKTTDGRVLFAIPWKSVVIVGTTDEKVDQPDLEPRPMEKEIDFILENANQYLDTPVAREDILSVYAGQRPLVSDKTSKSTAALSRDHAINLTPQGLITLAGGKWTTYRKMAQDCIDQAEKTADLEHRPCVTESLALDTGEAVARSSQSVHSGLPYVQADLIHAVRHDMARTIEDLLSRRTRSIILDARAAIAAAPLAESILCHELGLDPARSEERLAAFRKAAAKHLPV